MYQLKPNGFFLPGAVAALIIMLILTPLLMWTWNKAANALRQQSVARHFNVVEEGARNYAKSHYGTLIAQSTKTSGPDITIADLKNANCLPDRTSEKNAWNQGYKITSRLDDNGQLAMVVLTTGGRSHSARDSRFGNITVPETAAMAKAGFIPTGLIGRSNVLRGAYGAWEIPFGQIGISESAGHLGSISTLNSFDLSQDFLYRVEVPGHPELNAMQTSLDMTSHAINRVGSIQYTPHDIETTPAFCSTAEDEGRTFLDAEKGLYICRDGHVELLNDTGNSLMMKRASVVSNQALIDKPTCPSMTETRPEIFVAPTIASSGAESPSIVSYQTWATDFSDTQWQVHMRLLTVENQWVYPEKNYGKILVFSTCTSD